MCSPRSICPPGGGCTTGLASCGKCSAATGWPRTAAGGTSDDRLRIDLEADVIETTAPAPASMGLAARLFGVLLSPRATYAAIAERPRWLGALAVLLILAMGP